MSNLRSFISIRNIVIIVLLTVSLIKLGLMIEKILTNDNALSDFKIIYLASQSWVRGLNPYDHELLINLWEQDNNQNIDAPDINLTPSIYPITTYAILSPLSIMSWSKVKIIWTIINIFVLLMYIMLLKLSSISITEWRNNAGVFSLLLVPLQQCLL
jgi:hypothetical protein